MSKILTVLMSAFLILGCKEPKPVAPDCYEVRANGQTIYVVGHVIDCYEGSCEIRLNYETVLGCDNCLINRTDVAKCK